MRPIVGGEPYCKQCGYDIDRGESICPRCQFSPRQRGLKIALWLLLAVVVCMSFLIVVPSIGRVLIGVAAVAFMLSFVMLFVSFVATPYRLGSLFLRL